MRRNLFTPYHRRTPKPPKRRLVWYILKTAFRRLLMVFGAIFLFSVVSTLIAASYISGENEKAAKHLPGEMVLYFPLTESFIEHAEVEPFGFGDEQYTALDIIDALDHAARDSRVKGILVSLDGAMLGLSHIEDLRAAILRFRATGRKAWVYSTDYGDPGAGLGTYYLASVFDEIWMQPMGVVSIAGIRAEMPFIRDGLDRLGIKPEFFARKEYKSLFESATDSQMSDASREMTTALVEDLAGYMADGIALARGLDKGRLRTLVDKGIFTDDEALAAGLVTHRGDFYALEDHISTAVTGEPGNDDLYADFLYYAGHVKNTPVTGQHGVALVYALGALMSDKETVGAAFYGSTPATAEAIADEIIGAVEDEDAKIVVLRVDSPGGSPVAAETIRLAVTRAKEKGAKVIVSMGETAASGGYWVAAPADRIFASPVTMTGSIGVAGGKFALDGMWTKLGVNWDGVQYGQNAGMWSFNTPFSESQTERMNAMMDNIYNGFVARVAEGRKMSVEQADMVARGRVWTGRQAKENGLVDELGGLDAALDYAAKEIGAADRFGLDLMILPHPRSPWEELADMLGSTVRMGGTMETLASLKAMVEARRAGLLSAYESLTIQP